MRSQNIFSNTSGSEVCRLISAWMIEIGLGELASWILSLGTEGKDLQR